MCEEMEMEVEMTPEEMARHMTFHADMMAVMAMTPEEFMVASATEE